MKYFLKVFLPSFIGVMMLVSCSDDRSHPSFVEGIWKLERIVIDGNDDEDYARDWIWKFEKDVVEIDKINEEMHTREPHIGTWSVEAGVMTLCFNHSDSQYGPGEGPYTPPAEIYIVLPVTELKLERNGTSKLILTADAVGNGSVIEYRLKKQ